VGEALADEKVPLYCARRAGLWSGAPQQAQERFEFVRDNPDLATQMIALRTELLMRVLMPTLVPHSDEIPFLPMARFETGPGGNPHYHGCAAGAGNPRLLRVKADVGQSGAGDVGRGSDSEGGAPPVAGEASEEGSGEGSAGGAGEERASLSDGGSGGSGSEGSGHASEPEAAAQRLPGGRRWFHGRPLPRPPDNLMERNAGVQSQADMEKKFADF